MNREDLAKKMKFEQKVKGGEVGRPKTIGVKNIPGRRNRKCKVPEVRENMECSQNGMEADGPGVELAKA